MKTIGCSAKELLIPLALAAMFQAAPLGWAYPENPTNSVITYQARLTFAGLPANGAYDLRFVLYDGLTNGSPVCSAYTNVAVPVIDGLFTTEFHFGADAFTGAPRWLEIGVRANGAPEDFALLMPRQPLTAAPYAITAEKLKGLRTGDNTNGAPTSVAGSVVNYAAPGVIGSVIAGGGATNYLGQAYSNQVSASFAFLGGGYRNTIQNDALRSTLAGGYDNTIWANAAGATISGGEDNNIEHHAYDAVIAGGSGNDVQPFGQHAAIGGGIQNRINTSFGAAIPGGWLNRAGGFTSLAAGYNANATNDGAFVWSDYSSESPFGSTSSNQFLIRAAGGVGINTNNPAGAALNVNGTVAATSFIGSGASLSDVNASQLGGQSSSAFAPATGSSAYVSKTGDLMTGSLTVTNGVIRAASGLVIEGRTNDPPTPVVGQIWLRTDIQPQ